MNLNSFSFYRDRPIGSLDGHAPYRVSKAEFHPSGRFVATCV
jgi:U4/U6 small nuclear ribonucleoprotein PRP4